MQKINGGKLTKLDTRSEMRKAVDELLAVLPYQLEIMPGQAKALKVRYDLLVKEGFSEQQALEIIKTRPIFD